MLQSQHRGWYLTIDTTYCTAHACWDTLPVTGFVFGTGLINCGFSTDELVALSFCLRTYIRLITGHYPIGR